MSKSRRRTRKGVRNNWWDALNWNIQDYNIAHGMDTTIRWKQYPKMTGGGRDPYLTFLGLQNEEDGDSTSTNSLTNNTINYPDPSYNEVVYTIDKTITVKEKRYKYRVTEDGSHIVLRSSDTDVCFHIRIVPSIEYPGKKMAILQTFHQYSSCSLDDDGTGKDLFLAVIKILRSRKDIATMELQDESYKELENGKRIPLADMYFVCTGKTWYGSIVTLTPLNEELFHDSLQKLQTISWDTVFKCLQAKKPGLQLPVSIANMNTNSAGSAMKVFQRIKEAKTDFFADSMNSIISCIGYSSMKGTGWRYTF